MGFKNTREASRQTEAVITTAANESDGKCSVVIPGSCSTMTLMILYLLFQINFVYMSEETLDLDQNMSDNPMLMQVERNHYTVS